MFGTSGIRGIYGKEVTAALADQIGNAIGSKGSNIILAKDTRNTSPILADCLAAGAMLAGSNVIDIGICPTPLLAYATNKHKCNGAMVTASHNPPEYNGIKLFCNGMEFSRGQEELVKKAVAKAQNKAEWDKAGQKQEEDIAKEYVSFLLSKVDAAAIRKKAPKVLIDAGNAAAFQLAPALFEKAGCKVIKLYCDSPGKFERNLEPNPSTLFSAAEKVVKEKCDFGIAFDGDGDRAIAIDEKGKVLGLDVQLAIFCKHMMEKAQNRKIVTTVEASLCVREAVEACEGKLFVTPVGSLTVSQEVKKQSAAFGGEPCGEYVFPKGTPCADGLLAALTVAEIFCEKGNLSSLAGKIKSYPMERRKYKCVQAKKGEIMQNIKAKLKLEAKLSNADGLRYDFDDGWLLIRPSGTEPAIRLTCEFRTRERLQEQMKNAEKVLLKEIL